MKNQYVGDISDFEKYSILRSLSSRLGKALDVCWMLTPDDLGPDGRRLQYLSNELLMRHRDPEVFDALRSIVESELRSIEAIESSGMLPNAKYFGRTLEDGAVERARYFEEFFEGLTDGSLVFVDPDNGIAPRSQGIGRTKSSKFIFASEVQRIFNDGHSLVIFQHWPRLPREAFLQEKFEQLENLTGSSHCFAIHGGRVAFLVVPLEGEQEALAHSGSQLVERWSAPNALALTKHHT